MNTEGSEATDGKEEEEVVGKRKPWFVSAPIEGGFTKAGDGLEFGTQAECDAWIKANIPEGVIYMSMREGAGYEVTRKVTQI